MFFFSPFKSLSLCLPVPPPFGRFWKSLAKAWNRFCGLTSFLEKLATLCTLGRLPLFDLRGFFFCHPERQSLSAFGPRLKSSAPPQMFFPLPLPSSTSFSDYLRRSWLMPKSPRSLWFRIIKIDPLSPPSPAFCTH